MSWWGSRQAKVSSDDSGERGVDKRLHSAVTVTRSSAQSFNGLSSLWEHRDLNDAMRSTDQLPALVVTKITIDMPQARHSKARVSRESVGHV